jgi:hypothetical protein
MATAMVSVAIPHNKAIAIHSIGKETRGNITSPSLSFRALNKSEVWQPGGRCPSKRSAKASNLSQWKPQCVCPATYRKSGPVQSLGNNLGGARTEDEIPELFIPFRRPRPSWRTFHFPSPSAHLQLSRPDFSQNYLHLSGT